MASTAKKVDHTGVMFQFCRNHIVHGHWSITVMLSSTKSAWVQADTRWQKTNKSDIIWLYTFFTYPFKMLELPCHAHAWHIPQVWHPKWPHLEMTSFWTHSQRPQCSTFCIPVKQATPQRDQTPTHFEWSADEHICPLQVQRCWHMH